MTARQPYQPQLDRASQARRRRSAAAARRRASHSPHRGTAIEAIAILSVNAIISVISLWALAKLIPYGLTQQAKTRDLQTEVNKLDAHIQDLRTQFSRSFDPQRQQDIRLEDSGQLEPGQIRVRMMDKAVDQPTQTSESLSGSAAGTAAGTISDTVSEPVSPESVPEAATN